MKAKLMADPTLLDKLMFTDETKLRIFENQIGGNVCVKCRRDERLEPHNVNDSMKYGGRGSFILTLYESVFPWSLTLIHREHDRFDLHSRNSRINLQSFD